VPSRNTSAVPAAPAGRVQPARSLHRDLARVEELKLLALGGDDLVSGGVLDREAFQAAQMAGIAASTPCASGSTAVCARAPGGSARAHIPATAEAEIGVAKWDGRFILSSGGVLPYGHCRMWSERAALPLASATSASRRRRPHPPDAGRSPLAWIAARVAGRRDAHLRKFYPFPATHRTGRRSPDGARLDLTLDPAVPSVRQRQAGRPRRADSASPVRRWPRRGGPIATAGGRATAPPIRAGSVRHPPGHVPSLDTGIPPACRPPRYLSRRCDSCRGHPCAGCAGGPTAEVVSWTPRPGRSPAGTG
jgi:hypothetical protein